MRRLRQNVLIASVTLCLLGFKVFPQQLAKLEPLPVRDGLAALAFGNMQLLLCPGDDQWIAYQLKDVRRSPKRGGKYADLTPTGVPSLGLGGDIWLTNTRTGVSRNLTGSTGSSWAPAWSPNGKYLAFYSDRDGRAGVWLWDKTTDRIRKLSRAIPRPFIYGYDLPNWTPDSRRILVKLFPDEATFERLVADSKEPREPGGVRVSIYQSTADPNRAATPAAQRSDALTVEEVSDFKADLALIDIGDGTVTRILKGYVPAGSQLSPDGNQIAFLNAKGSSQAGPAFDLVVISLLDRKVAVLASNLIQGSLGDRLTWSPESNLLCYLSSANWFLIPSTGGVPRRVTETTHPPFKAWDQLPLWSGDGHWLYFSTGDGIWKVATSNGQAQEVGQLKGKRLQFIVTSGNGRFWTIAGGRSIVLGIRDELTRRTGFYAMDLSTGRTMSLIEGDKEIRRPQWVTGSTETETFYYVAQDASHAPDIWALSASANASPQRLTHVNPVFDQYLMGEGQLIDWVSSDGSPLRGALMLPAGYKKGQRYPLIVNVYGGFLLSERVNQFGFTSNTNITNQQFWATRGYAVLMPDAPLRVGTPMLDLAKTVLPGVDKVIEMGIADPERVGVWGGSYGGYSTLALLVQTTRFKAAAIDSGFANLLSVYGWMAERSNEPTWQDWAETSQGRMGGTPWQYRERYLENSPLFYLDRVQTPVLIIQGTEDAGGKDFYSNEIFMNLNRLGKEATYVKYRGAGHTISSFNYTEQVDVLERMLSWFDSHLKTPQYESR
jgi:dipeptidyl aminopeptidase/acylaminoacyl peptidase